jgi:hypothetical protein
LSTPLLTVIRKVNIADIFSQKCDALYSSGGHPLIADDEIAGDVI